MMEEVSNRKDRSRKDLGVFTRIVFAFYGGLLLISLYQQASLYEQGILESLLGANFFLSALHHLGFTAILALVLSFVFNALEARKPNLGVLFTRGIFLGILGVEFLLTLYFTVRYEVPTEGVPVSFGKPPAYLGVHLLIGFLLLALVFIGIYRKSGGLQLWISRMYPFTIVLFSMFLGTLLSEKRPVNQNKTEKMLISWAAGPVVEEAHTADILPYEIPPVSPRELVWVHSVFSGSDFDKAYQIARSLAHEGQREHAKWLARHILWEVPGHVDAEILLGRLYAWQQDFDKSAEILEVSVSNYPVYEDGYAALLDTYYWSGQHQKAMGLQGAIERHIPDSILLKEKLQRSRNALREGNFSRTGQLETASALQAKRAHRP